MENQKSRAIEEPAGQGPDGLTAGQAVPQQGSLGGGTTGGAGTNRLKEISSGLLRLHAAGWSWIKIGEVIGRSATAVGYVASMKTGMFGEKTLQKLEEFLTSPDIANPPNPYPQKPAITLPADGNGKQSEVDRRADKYPDGDRKNRYLKTGPALRERREFLGISRAEMAKRLGWSAEYLLCFENITLSYLPSSDNLDLADAEIMGRSRHRYCGKRFSKKMLANLIRYYREEKGIDTRRELVDRFKVGWETIVKLEEGREECRQNVISKVVESIIEDLGEEGFDRLVEIAKGGKGTIKSIPLAAPVGVSAPALAPVPGDSAKDKSSTPKDAFAPMRIKFRLLRELPGVSVGAEWWWPPRGEWVVKLKDNSREATNFLKTFDPEFMVAKKDYFQILGIEAVKE